MGCEYILQPIIEINFKDGSPSIKFIDFCSALPMYMYDYVEDDFFEEINRRIQHWKLNCPIEVIFCNEVWKEIDNNGQIYKSINNEFEMSSKFAYISPPNQGISIGYKKSQIIDLVSCYSTMDKIASIKIYPDAEKR